MAGRQWTCERIHADRKAGGGLWRHLRRRGRKPDRKGGRHSGRGRIPGRADISERPDVVEAKERVGDREADTNQRQGHRRRAGVAGGQGVQAHAARKGREEDGGRGRLGHDRHAGPSPRAHGHRGQRQGVRGPCQGGRGAGRGVLLRAALPLLGARHGRAHQRPRAGIPAQGHGSGEPAPERGRTRSGSRTGAVGGSRAAPPPQAADGARRPPEPQALAVGTARACRQPHPQVRTPVAQAGRVQCMSRFKSLECVRHGSQASSATTAPHRPTWRGAEPAGEWRCFAQECKARNADLDPTRRW